MERVKLDLNTWKRKVHFEFFSKFEDPYFGICVEVDCTLAFKKAKEMNTSFFLYYLHKSLGAVNAVEEFRHRIEEGEVYDYKKIDASPTIGRENGTFGFSYMPYHEDYHQFVESAKKEIELVQDSDILETSNTGKIHVIHYSSIPWLKFTSVKHAQSFAFKDSVPKISFGKVTEVAGKMTMPVSVHAHHALVDGLHVGQHIERFQELLNE